MPAPLVMYHADCMDGFCSAWLTHRIMPQAEFVPMAYGDPVPDCRGRVVYLLDMCFELEKMDEIAAQSEYLFVFDHHISRKPVMDKIFEWPRTHIIFHENKSGARITYDYLAYAGLMNDRPFLVDYIEDRDLWRFAIPDSREVNAALQSYPKNFAVWDVLYKDVGIDRLREEGIVVRRMVDAVVREHVARSYMSIFAAHRVPVVNATHFYSEIGEALAEGNPFSATYRVLPDGRYRWSLRSTKDGIDVSQIAALFPGGGGHKRAAGFTFPPDIDIGTPPENPQGGEGRPATGV